MKLLVLFFCLTQCVNCAKILGVFHFPSPSHYILGRALFKALAKKGHQVTIISPFKSNTNIENYEEIELTGALQLKEEMFMDTIANFDSYFTTLSNLMSMVEIMDEHFMTHNATKELLSSTRKFDLVIQSYFGNDAYLALAHKFDAASIVFSTLGSNYMINRITGNSAPYSYVPNVFCSYGSDGMTFSQRLSNTLLSIAMESFSYIYMNRRQNYLLQEYFPHAPSARQLRENVSLVLLNSHYSIESPRPYLPSMIQVGGLQIEEPKELSGDIKDFIESASNGVIFCSLGSNVISSSLPKDKLQIFIDTFGNLSEKVLWKYEEDVINLPKNMKIRKWLPQRDILAHPNVKLFITHGGLLSITEAIYHGVPMVGIPLFGDQNTNVDDGVANGYVVKMNFGDMSVATFNAAINEVLNNPRYRENVQNRGKILRDQLVKPLDKAVYWVEYVLRHKGAHHLKSAALKLEWYQYYLLDVLAFLLACVAILGYLGYSIIKIMLKFAKNLLTKKSTNISNKSKKTKTKKA